MFHHALVFHRGELGNIKIVIHDHMDFGLSPNISIQYFRLAAYSALYRLKRINVIAVMEKKKNAYLFLKSKWFVPNGLSLERYVDRSMSPVVWFIDRYLGDLTGRQEIQKKNNITKV